MKTETEYIAEEQVFHGFVPRVMGTRLEMLIIGKSEEEAGQLWDRLHDLAFSLDRIMNRFDPESEVSMLNISDNPLEMPMSMQLEEIVALSERYNERTCGLFDVVDPDGKLDFGGFGKGYFLKKCKELLHEADVSCAFVDFGNSSILGVGHHPYGDHWPVGVVDPYTRRTIKTVCLCDSAMSTSGNSPTYSGHVRNPHTGERCNSRKLVCVLCEDPLDAEVLSTAMMLADAEQAGIIKKFFPKVRIEIF